MDDQPDLREFLNEVSSFQEEGAPACAAPRRRPAPGGLDGQRRRNRRLGFADRLDADKVRRAPVPQADPSIAMSGQVGSQIKTIVGNSWLIANVRTLRAGDDGELVAHVDFLGEGTRDSSGKISNFRRGVTRYPIPGADVLPVSTEDMRAIFAAERRAAHRDRHRLSDRRHSRRALRRPDARQAFRRSGIDRYRQVDLGRADPAPHLGAQRPRVTS